MSKQKNDPTSSVKSGNSQLHKALLSYWINANIDKGEQQADPDGSKEITALRRTRSFNSRKVAADLAWTKASVMSSETSDAFPENLSTNELLDLAKVICNKCIGQEAGL